MPRARSSFPLLRAVIGPPGSWIMVVGCLAFVACGSEAVDVEGCDEYSIQTRKFHQNNELGYLLLLEACVSSLFSTREEVRALDM